MHPKHSKAKQSKAKKRRETKEGIQIWRRKTYPE
jgi:hypothetical protein